MSSRRQGTTVNAGNERKKPHAAINTATRGKPRRKTLVASSHFSISRVVLEATTQDMPLFANALER